MSTKKAELGIGQASFTSYRYELVDYLPWMSVYEWPVSSIKPKEIATLGTLSYPVDTSTWVFVAVAMMGEFIILIVMQIVWSSFVGKPISRDIVYQGKECPRHMILSAFIC